MQQMRQNSPEGQEPLDFVTCQCLGRENIWKSLKNFSFRQGLTIIFCCSSSGGAELAFTSLSGKEYDTCPENEEFFPVKCPAHHRGGMEKHHPLFGGSWDSPSPPPGWGRKKKQLKNSCSGFPSPPPSLVCSLELERERSCFTIYCHLTFLIVVKVSTHQRVPNSRIHQEGEQQEHPSAGFTSGHPQVSSATLKAQLVRWIIEAGAAN